MSAITSHLENVKRQYLQQEYQPFNFAVGFSGVIILIWSAITVGDVANFRLVLELLALTTIAQLVILTIRKSGLAFAVNQAVNLAAISIFGLQSGLIIAFSSQLIVWAYETIRRKRALDHSLEMLAFNAGSELVALFFAGVTMLGFRQILPSDSGIWGAIPWLAAAIVNDQINFALLATMLKLKKGTNRISFWRRSLWAMPINITIGALGGALLANAALQLGLSGVMIFMFPLILVAYAFNVHMEVNQAQLKHVKTHVNELEAANQALTLLSKKKESMLDHMTIEIETTLLDIRDATTTLIETKDVLPQEKRIELLEKITGGEQEIGRIIGSIEEVTVDTAEIDSQPEPKLFNLSELVDKVTQSFESEAEEKQLRLRSISGDVPTFIEADEAMIQHLVHQLISNAIQFTKSGGSVFVTVKAKDGMASINVEDTGVGIAKSEIKRIFDPNYKVEKHADLADGEGMGLAFVNRYIEAHNGSVSIESNVGLGSTFSVSLPIAGINSAPPTDAIIDSPSIYATSDFFIHAREVVEKS